jgi:hypothetical protein
MPALTGAHGEEGTREILLGGDPPRDFMSRLLDHALGQGNHHPVELQLFYMNIRRNAAERVAAFSRTSASAPGPAGSPAAGHVRPPGHGGAP